MPIDSGQALGGNPKDGRYARTQNIQKWFADSELDRAIMQDWFKEFGVGGAKSWRFNSAFKDGTQRGFHQAKPGSLLNSDNEDIDPDTSEGEHHKLSHMSLTNHTNSSDTHNDQEFVDEFVAELQDAIEHSNPDTQLGSDDYSHREARDVLKIKSENGSTLDGGSPNHEAGASALNQIQEFAYDDNYGAKGSGYDYTWTGM